MKVTVRQMQIFDAVATLGSVTAAADHLNMSQSAASSALTDLQIILGRTLFSHAKGRPLQITEEGRRLHATVRSLIARIEEMEQHEADAPLCGKLVIGATAVIAETVLPRLCIEFMQRHPQVRVRVDAESVGDLFERLGRFELETALIENFPQVDGIELVKWRSDELILVVAPEHPLAGRKQLSLKDLAGQAWCMREAASSVSARLRYLLHEKVGQLDVAFESTSNWAIRHAVRAGGGIGCLSRALVQLDLKRDRLIQLDVPDFRYTRQLSLARPKDIWRSPLVSAFDDFLLSSADRSLIF